MVVLLHILYSFIFGLPVLVFILGGKKCFSRMEYVVLSYLLGFGIIAYLLFICLLFVLGDGVMFLQFVVVSFLLGFDVSIYLLFAFSLFASYGWGLGLFFFSFEQQLFLLGLLVSFFYVYLFYFLRGMVLEFKGGDLLFRFLLVIVLQIFIVFLASTGLGVIISETIDIWSGGGY